MYLNSVQRMVSGELAGECLQTGFERHGLSPQRAPLDTVYPLREHLNSVHGMVSGGYCEGLFSDTVCWTRLRNTWQFATKLFPLFTNKLLKLVVGSLTGDLVNFVFLFCALTLGNQGRREFRVRL